MWQIVLNGPGYLDTDYELPDGDTFLGRADDNDIVLSGDLVSRRHARFVRSRDGLTVEDAGSRNGTKVNNTKIEARTRLQVGDIVGIGENRISVRKAAQSVEVRTEMVAAAHLDPPTNPNVRAAATPSPSLATPLPVAPPPAPPAVNQPILLKQEVGRAEVLDQIERARALGSTSSLAEGKVAPEVASLVLLYQVSERLATAPSIERFLEDVCELVMDVASARTVVALMRTDGEKLRPVAFRHRGSSLARGEVPVSDSVIAESIRARAVLCVADVGRDSRFSGKESVVLYGVSQVISVPLFRGDEVVGVLYVTRDGNPVGGDLPRLVEALTAIGHLSASGIEQQRLRQRAAEEARVRKVLERFHAPDIVDRVVKDFSEAAGPRMEEKYATVLFGDISGFTPLTERLPAERIVGLLDEFYRRMTTVIFSFGGTVDKFIGDAVMAIFGAPYPRGDDPARAVRAAMAMRFEFNRMMAQRPVDEQCNLSIGVNTGRMLVGTVGGEGRLEYTAVGDAVNVSARVQSTAQGGQILITGATLEALGGRFVVHPLGEQKLKGRREAVSIYAVEDEDLSASTLSGARDF